MLDVVDVVMAENPHRCAPAMAAARAPPAARVVAPIAVADLASESGLPLGLCRCCSATCLQGLVGVVKPTKGSPVDESVLKSVLEGLRAL
jgi:hypothetical protein